MNDRFKFRVWDVENKEYHSMDDVINNDGELGCAAWTVGFIKYRDGLNIVEQCTGLKDKNGKLIYEGDIMEHRIYLGNPELYIVKWSESVNGWVYQDAKNSLKTSYILSEFTDSIIGNIHENPELLKESK